MAGWNATSNIMGAKMVFDAVEKNALRECSQATKNLGAKILKSAKENAPVITGALRRSGRLQQLKGAGSNFTKLLITFGGKGTSVDYAISVELGTSKQSGQFYLLRAVRKHSPQLIQFNLKAFESVWNNQVRKSKLMKLV